MKYRIEQERYNHNMCVYTEEKEYLKVFRRFAKAGICSDFYQEEQLICRGYFRHILFTKKIAIEFHLFDEPVIITKVGRKFNMQVGEDVLTIKSHLLKTPFYTFIKNGVQVGVVNGKTFGVIEDPTIYHAIFDKEDNRNFYLLLFLLIQLPVQMGAG